jgi:hypothetical protein
MIGRADRLGTSDAREIPVRTRLLGEARLAELTEDDFTAENLLDIAHQYDELAEHGARRQRRLE